MHKVQKILPFFVFFLALFLIFYIAITQGSFGSILGNTTNTSFTLISTGDVGLVRYINFKTLQENNFQYPFMKIAKYLKNADLTVINLEGPLINNCPTSTSGFIFCGEDDLVSGLLFAGVDAANLANNHSTNYGIRGLEETASLLSKNKITPFGLKDQVKYVSINGNTVALIGFVELGNNWGGLSNATGDNVKKLTEEAKSHADVVVAAFHWGPEYTRTPTKNMMELAHLAVDSGADLVLGNHAHWIMHDEIYQGVPIIYAQGNTIFDQDWSEETKEGVIYKFQYENGKFKKIDERYTIIEENAQPRFTTDAETNRVKEKLSY